MSNDQAEQLISLVQWQYAQGQTLLQVHTQSLAETEYAAWLLRALLCVSIVVGLAVVGLLRPRKQL